MSNIANAKRTLRTRALSVDELRDNNIICLDAESDYQNLAFVNMVREQKSHIPYDQSSKYQNTDTQYSHTYQNVNSESTDRYLSSDKGDYEHEFRPLNSIANGVNLKDYQNFKSTANLDEDDGLYEECCTSNGAIEYEESKYIEDSTDISLYRVDKHSSISDIAERQGSKFLKISIKIYRRSND